jgi:hypothetical protein
MHKETGQYPPIGSILGWAKSISGIPSLPDGWVECNDQELTDTASPYNGYYLPDLNGVLDYVQKFLRGSTTSGSTGGAETHTHSFPMYSSDSFGITGSYIYYVSTSSMPYFDSPNSLPPYYEVVWILRIK